MMYIINAGYLLLINILITLYVIFGVILFIGTAYSVCKEKIFSTKTIGLAFTEWVRFDTASRRRIGNVISVLLMVPSFTLAGILTFLVCSTIRMVKNIRQR